MTTGSNSDKQVPTLPSIEWKTRYTSQSASSLVHAFLVPALSCSVLYRRLTGYFNEEALRAAALGIESLISNGGRMDLVVGMTLSPIDVHKINTGLTLREVAEEQWANIVKPGANQTLIRQAIGPLAWLVAKGKLDIRLAIRRDSDGRPMDGQGLFHTKQGIFVDAAGNRMVFTGSVNETEAGWLKNAESFDVSLGWAGGRDAERVKSTCDEFERIWNNTESGLEVMDLPEAIRLDLLNMAPEAWPPPPEPEEEPDPDPTRWTAADQWLRIAQAPSLPVAEGGATVTVQTCAVEPWPHQQRAFMRMAKDLEQNGSFRLLIADEVGLGKTIQAGLILRHAWIGQRAKRILILAPAGILKQWQLELSRKFNLHVPVFDSGRLYWPSLPVAGGYDSPERKSSDWTTEPLVLVSSQLARRDSWRKKIVEAEPWDMVVLDEAHHARKGSEGAKKARQPNKLLRLMMDMVEKDRARSLLLMTATPMQLDPLELYDLLWLLGLGRVEPYRQWSESVFTNYYDTLNQKDDSGKEIKPKAKELQGLLSRFRDGLDAKSQVVTSALMVLGSEQILKKEGLSPFQWSKQVCPGVLESPLVDLKLEEFSEEPQREMSRRIMLALGPPQRLVSRNSRKLLKRYRDEVDNTLRVPERHVEDVPIPMPPAERALYDEVEEYIRNVYDSAKGDKRRNAIGFILTVYRRRIASSFLALKRTLGNRLAKLTGAVSATNADLELQAEFEEYVEDGTQLDKSGDVELSDTDKSALKYETKEIDRLREIQEKADKLSGSDEKAGRLLELLRSKFDEALYTQAIVFTQYGDTMEFLREYLAANPELGTIGCYSGKECGVVDRGDPKKLNIMRRDEVKRKFLDGDIQVLVCTDAAAEGLNLQKCGLLVNFDLPWNPTRVEQRIGRIDRIGQRFDEVLVYNLMYEETVEADVYAALKERAEKFGDTVGSAQPIHATLHREIGRAVLELERRDAGQAVIDAIDSALREQQRLRFRVSDINDLDFSVEPLHASPLGDLTPVKLLGRSKSRPPGVACKGTGADTDTWLSFELDLGEIPEASDRNNLVPNAPHKASLARVTDQPSHFALHDEELQLLWHGCPHFDALTRLAEVEVDQPNYAAESGTD